MAKLDVHSMERNIDYVPTVILSGHLFNLVQPFGLSNKNKFLL